MNGIGVFDECTKPTLDEIRGKVYPAWASMNDESKGLTRAIDKTALPIIYSVTTSGANATAILHEMYTYTKAQLEKKKLKLLINELEAKEFLIDNFDFLKKDSYEQAELMMPYIQTGKLIAEMTQLESEIRAGYVVLKEPPGRRKDRAMCLFYGMYYAKILEAEFKKNSSKVQLSDMYGLTSNFQKKQVSPFGALHNPFALKGNPFTR